MHIPDGFVPPSVCIAGYAITGGTTWYCLHKINKEKNPQAKIPKAALLTAAFFVVNAINIPIPPSSLHFVLNGLMGVVLGYYAFPAVLVGLFFEAVMFQHGGLSTLGVNAVIMGHSRFSGLLHFSTPTSGKESSAKVDETLCFPSRDRRSNDCRFPIYHYCDYDNSGGY